MADGGEKLKPGRQRQQAGGVQETREVVDPRWYHHVIEIKAVTAASRYQLPRLDGIRRFRLQSRHTNSVAGNNRVYYGDESVTNLAGTKVGRSLAAGAESPEFFLSDPSKMWVAGDFVGDLIVLTGTG